MSTAGAVQIGDPMLCKRVIPCLDVCDGRVVISLSTVSTSDESDTQYLYFNEAKCFSLSECYDVDNSRRRLLKLGVMAEEIKIDDVKFKRI